MRLVLFCEKQETDQSYDGIREQAETLNQSKQEGCLDILLVLIGLSDTLKLFIVFKKEIKFSSSAFMTKKIRLFHLLLYYNFDFKKLKKNVYFIFYKELGEWRKTRKIKFFLEAPPTRL